MRRGALECCAHFKKELFEIIRDGKKERKYSSNVQEKGQLYGRYSERVFI